MYLVMALRDIKQTVKLNILRKKSASKHLTYIVLMIENAYSITEQWLLSTFETFWRIWILNVAVIYYHEDHLHIYRYDPFLRRLFAETQFGGRHYLTVRDIFPKTILNMRLHPLRMCMYNDGIRTVFDKGNSALHGSDGMMSGYLAERLNATRVIHLVEKYGNTSVHHDICFREIVDEIDDVAINIRFLSLATFYRRVEHTIVHSRDDLCAMVPKAKIASSFWNLFRSFNVYVWLLIFATLIFAACFCILNYRKISSDSKFFLHLYACIISMPLLRLRRPTSLRLFFLVWLVFGMLISAAFKGNLTSNLVDRQYLPDINTIQDLALSPYPLAVLPRHTKHLQTYLDRKNQYSTMLLDKAIEIPDLQLNYLMESNNLSYAYLQKFYLSTFHANSRRHTKNGRPLFHVMQQCIVPFYAVYIVPYGSPYLGFINTLMRNAQEFGFINYWNRLMSAAFRISRGRLIRRREEDEPIVLKLSHYQAVFCFLFVGLSLSTLCFLYEILTIPKIKKIFIYCKTQ